MIRRRLRPSRLKNELRSIFEENGRLPDFTRFERKRTSRVSNFLWKTISVLLVLSTVSWLGFFVWTRIVLNNAETLATQIEGPTTVTSGEEVTYHIRYTNEGNVPIAALEMKLQLPDGFLITSQTPEATDRFTWTLGSLEANSDGEVTIHGVFISEVPSSQRVQALFTYKPANFNSNFQEIVTTKVDINASIIALSIDGPTKAIAGDELTYTINVQNRSDRVIEGMRLDGLFPKEFILGASEPELTDPTVARWMIKRLEPRELTSFILKGSFSSTGINEQTLTIRAGFLLNDQFIKQAESSVVTDVISAALTFHLIVSGSTVDQTVNLGDTMRVSVDYANTSGEKLDGLSFALKLAGMNGKKVPIVWSRADLGAGIREGETVRWKTVATDAGIFDLSLPLAVELVPVHDDRFTLVLSATIGKIGSLEGVRTIESTPITVSVNSDVDVRGEARWSDEEGNIVGSGPIPPTVGETTSYRIFWTINNDLHQLDRIRLEAILPSSVSWMDQKTAGAGTISFDPASRRVSWQISSLPVEASEVIATFDVSITPNNADRGTTMKLVQSPTFEAIDAATRATLTRTLEAITTALSNDEAASGKGVVQ